MEFMEPNSKLGIIHGGSSDQQLAIQAQNMGFQVTVLTDQPKQWTNVVSKLIVGDYHNLDLLERLFQAVDLVLYNDSQIELPDPQQLAQPEKLVQGTEILDLMQDRYLERCFLNEHNLNITPYVTVVNKADLQMAVSEIGFPCLLKPIQRAVDPDFQETFYNQEQIDNYQLPQGSFILESLVDIHQEVFAMVTKDGAGDIKTYPLIKVTRPQGLKTALVTKTDEVALKQEVQEIAQTIGSHLHYQGLFAIKLCTTKSGMLYVERLYPGTVFSAQIFAAVTQTSQEELLIRSLCNWPLPNLTPWMNGCELQVTKKHLSTAVALIQQHPQWQLKFNHREAGFPTDQTEVGTLVVFAENEQQLINYVNATELWQI